MMDIRMIASDVDGTLLPYGGELPEITRVTWNALYEKGIEMVPASGRVWGAFPKMIQELKGRYVISSNGAVITDRVEKRRLYEALIPPEQAAELLERLRRYEVYTCVYMNDWAYNWDEIPAFVDLYYPGRPLFRHEPQKDLAKYIQGCSSGIEKIFVVVSSQEVKAQIRREMDGIPGIQCTSSSIMNLEINHEAADKGTAVAWLGRYLGIDAAHTLAMGDNENDETMFRYAGYSIVPKNAKSEIRALADRQVGECRDGGVAYFLREMFLEK